MLSKIENIALKSPYWMRILASNILTYRLFRLRTPDEIQNRLSENSFNGYFDLRFNEIKNAQGELINKLLHDITKHTTYYKRYTDVLELDDAFEAINKLPIISKDLARKIHSDLINQRMKSEGVHTVLQKTSGSTGTPYQHYWSKANYLSNYMLRNEWYKYHGFNPYLDWNLRLGGRTFLDVNIKKPPFHLFDYPQKQLLFSIYHLSDRNLGTFIKTLIKKAPRVVTGYPSAIYLLANYCRRKGIEGFKPDLVFFDSETVLDYQKSEVEEVWGASVAAQYGLDETGQIANTCKNGNYHLLSLNVFTEILDGNDNPCNKGEHGHIVSTSLFNFYQPLIRYRTGDRGFWAREKCNCGWNTPVIGNILGRKDDVVKLPDGRQIGRLDHIFKSVKQVRQSQIIQRDIDNIHILIDTEPGFSDGDREFLLAEAVKRLGSDINIKIKITDQFEYTSKRKFRAVISKVK